MKRILLNITLLSIIFLSSCFKEEEPYPRKKIPEGVRINAVSLGKNYANQVYFDLSSNKIVRSNSITDWDIAFEGSGSSYFIVLNPALMTAVANMGQISFDSNLTAPSSASNLWKWDDTKGDINKTAIDKWGIFDSEPVQSKGYVYIIDLGIDVLGISRGYQKMIVQKFESGKFFIKYADLDGGNENTRTIAIDPNVNFITFSFEKGVTGLEPDKNNWDLLFSRSRESLLSGEDTVQYSVVGVYLNPLDVEALMMDSSAVFEDVNIDDVWSSSYHLSTDRNVIGHEWKWYNLDAGYYTVLSDQVYIIKDAEESYYKLRFLSFLNDLGERGFPKFEFQKLN